MKIFALCKPYLLSQKHNLFAYIALTLLTAAISILSPYIIGGFLDGLIQGGDAAVVLRFAVIFGALNLLRIIKGYISAI